MNAFVRSGDVLGDLFLPQSDRSNGIGIVWCPGLPNNPIAEDMGAPLSNEGFTVFQGRYPGSWQSYGSFGPEASINGALCGLELLARGRTEDLAAQVEVTWNVDRLILVGSSYGGGVALCALAESDLAGGAIAFCPLIDPCDQNRECSQPEDNLETLYPFLRRCHENVFRGLDEREWQLFMAGESRLYPPSRMHLLAQHRLLLVHGTADTTIRAYHTTRFHTTLVANGAAKTTLLLADGVGHGRALRMATRQQWLGWLQNGFQSQN